MAMSAFRRSAATETKQRSGKGSKGAWYERMRIPKGIPTPLVILRGGYKDLNPPQELVEIDPATGRPKDVINDFFKYRSHTRKLMNGGKESYRDEPCSAGTDPHNPQPCAGCSAMDQGDKSISVKDVYAFSAVHLHPYHIHPLIDRDSRQIVMKQNTQEPVMVFSECEGRTCNFCRVSRGEQPIIQQGDMWPGWQANQFTTTFGHRRYLEVGKSHLSDLEGFEQTISSICGSCSNQLITDGFACPTCNSMIINMETDPRNDAQINEAVLKPYPCLQCRRAVLLREIVSCEVCGAAQRQFVQNSLFDCVLFLFKQGEGTKSHIMMQRYMPIDAFGQQLAQMGWLTNGKTIRQLIEEIGKPYEFAEIFKPRSLDDQVKKLNLRTAGPQQPAYGAYGAPAYGQQPGYPPQPGPMVGGFPAPAGYVPSQPTGFLPPGPQTAPAAQFMPPQQTTTAPPAYAPYPQTVSAAPVAPQNNAGPAPFQPTPRTNFGS